MSQAVFDYGIDWFSISMINKNFLKKMVSK